MFIDSQFESGVTDCEFNCHFEINAKSGLGSLRTVARRRQADHLSQTWIERLVKPITLNLIGMSVIENSRTFIERCESAAAKQCEGVAFACKL